jgi:hypothetical protein
MPPANSKKKAPLLVFAWMVHSNFTTPHFKFTFLMSIRLVESIKKTTEPLGDSTILPEGEGNPWADESGGGCIIC